MIFTREQAALIRQGKLNAALTNHNVKPGQIRSLRRRFMRHDEDGNELGPVTETVRDGDTTVVLTIFEAQQIDVADLELSHALACGYRTVEALRESWRRQHPKTPTATFVRFLVGDRRDRDRFLNWSGRAGGDYTFNPSRAMDPDAPVVPATEMRQINARRSRDDGRDDERQRRRGVNLSARLKDAIRRQDATEIRRLRRELGVLEREIERKDAA